MKEERKKVERNLVGSITPKKREEPIVKETPTESKTSVKSKTEPKQEPETPKTVLKFVKVFDSSKQEERKENWLLVQKNVFGRSSSYFVLYIFAKWYL
jgi:hypothetical protein